MFIVAFVANRQIVRAGSRFRKKAVPHRRLARFGDLRIEALVHDAKKRLAGVAALGLWITPSIAASNSSATWRSASSKSASLVEK